MFGKRQSIVALPLQESVMNNKPKFLLLLGYLILFTLSHSYATVLVIPEAGNIVGAIQQTYSRSDETIDEAGRRFNVGYYAMVRANPHADAIHVLPPHTPLVIPSQFILPDVPRTGIVINLAEYRLYYFPPDENVVITFPVGIGKEGWGTPLGVTKITAKVANPTWRPTANVRAAAEEIGAPLPSVFPPGPNNPLGKHVLRLGWPTILIHGTNRADGVGARVSAGCIRMLPNDIEYLFELVSTGTQVRIINESVKIGQQDGTLFLQMHPILKDQQSAKLEANLITKLTRFNIKNVSHNEVIRAELGYPSGLVIKIKG